MPSPINLDLEYARRVKKAEQMRLKALELAEAAYKLRLSNIETWKQEQLSVKEEKKKEKEEKAKQPRVRRTKEQIEIDEIKERLQKERDEKHKRYLENKELAKSSSNTVPETPKITSIDRNRMEVFGGVSSFLGFDEEEEEEEEQVEEEEDEWDISGMTEAYIPRWLQSRIRDGATIPEHLRHYLEPQKKKSSPPEDVIIPEEELSPAPPAVSILPPPRPTLLSKQEQKRKPVKQVKGVHSYSLPVE